MRLPIQFETRLVPRPSGALAAVAVLTALAACTEPPPRSFQHFMEDRIAREGVLARCDREADEPDDIECANARRAAATLALRKERERREALERESRRKIEALRAQIERREREAREAAEAAARAYDRQWEEGAPGAVSPPAAGSPADIAPASTPAASGAGTAEARPAASLDDGPEYVPAARSADSQPPDEPPEGAVPDSLGEVPVPARQPIELAD